jgi:hypothetical protein
MDDHDSDYRVTQLSHEAKNSKLKKISIQMAFKLGGGELI